MECIAEICREEPGDFAVVSYGRNITVLLSAILGRRLGVDAWSRIAMPDWTLLDLGRGAALAGFAAESRTRP